jgi:arginine:agmatine antiporter
MGTLLVTTTMIGSGVFLLPATVASVGTISTIAWFLAAAGAILIGLTLGFLARLPGGGGFVDSIGTWLGPVPALVAAILYWLGVLLSVTAVAVAVAGYVGFLLPALARQPASSWTAIAFIALVVALNALGGRRVAQWGSATLLVGLFPILLVSTAGWAHFDADLFRAGWNVTGRSNASALVQATLLVFWAFLGLETASVVSRHMRDPDRTVPIATVGGILISAVVYIAATTAISGMIPAETLATSTAPFADATARILGGIAAALVAAAGAAKASGTLGSLQLATVESWRAAQRQAGLAGLGHGATNVLMGVLASLFVLLTASPTLAEQYGLVIGAVVALSFLVFALAGVALARARGGLQRGIGVATTLFCLGLLAAQPAGMLLAAAVCLVVATLPVIGLARRRGWRLQLPPQAPTPPEGKALARG